LPQQATLLIPFHVEHIVSKQHGGTDDPGGLALACDRCNAYKGPHFVVRRGHIVGLTPRGRATVRLLNMNAPRRVELREAWLREDDWR